MGRKLDILLGRTSRQTSKLKTFLGLTVSRLAVLRNHRQVRRDQARGDVVQLLQLGHVDRALLRVEHVIKEQNMLDVFVMIEHYCHLLTERAPLLDRKECPEELREAISSLVFAASRCAELPELDKARGIFSSRYGKELVSAAVELRNNCCVDPKGNSMVSPPTHLNLEQLESDDNPYASHEELSPAGRIGYVVQAQRQFDASLDDSKPGKHQIYYRRNETRNSEMNNNSLHEETHKVGSRSGTESNYSTYNNAEKTYLDSSSTMRPLNLSSGKKPISVRTRRGL